MILNNGLVLNESMPQPNWRGKETLDYITGKKQGPLLPPAVTYSTKDIGNAVLKQLTVYDPAIHGKQEESSGILGIGVIGVMVLLILLLIKSILNIFR